MPQIIESDLFRQLGSIEDWLEVPHDQVMLSKRLPVFYDNRPRFDQLTERLSPLMHYREGRGIGEGLAKFNFADVLKSKE